MSVNFLTIYDITNTTTNENQKPQKEKIEHDNPERINQIAKTQLDGIEENQFPTYVKLKEKLSKSDSDTSANSDDPDDLFVDLPSKWIEALDELNDDEENEEPILNLLKSDEINELTEEQKETIFDNLISTEKKRLIIESLRLKLPMKLRYDLFNIGINRNDKEIVLAAINGIEGQKKINLIKMNDNKSFIFLAHLRSHGICPTILDLLYNISPFEEKDIIDGEWRKFLFNIWSLDDATFMMKGETIEYEGAPFNYFPPKIQSSFESFKEKFPQKYEKIPFQELSCLIRDANLSPARKIEKYERNEPVLIHGGNEDHLIEILLIKQSRRKKYLAICDKDILFEHPVTIFKITKQIEEVLIRDIELRNFTTEERDKFFKKTLIKKLTGNALTLPHEWTKSFTKNWIGEKYQQKNNCIYESVKTAFIGFAAIWDILKNGAKSVKPAFEKMADWEMYFMCWSVSEYLNYCSQNPERVDQYLLSKIFSKGKEIIKDPDYLEYFAQSENLYTRLRKE